jgi:transcriptional regulator with XRE-family HTH domain
MLTLGGVGIMSDVIDTQILRSLRAAKGWDQQTLASTAGVDPSVISRLERGLQVDLKASVLVALAHALDVPVDSLIATPYQHSALGAVAELTAAMAALTALSAAHQRQVAALVRAYVSSMPD